MKNPIDIKSIFSRTIMVLLSLLFMSTPLAIANPTNVETVMPRNKDHHHQWPLNRDIQLYLWESFKSADNAQTRRSLLETLKSIPLYELDIDLERKLVGAFLGNEKPEFREPAKYILGYRMEGHIILQQLDLTNKIYMLSKQVPFPRSAIKEAKEELINMITPQERMYAPLVQRLGFLA